MLISAKLLPYNLCLFLRILSEGPIEVIAFPAGNVNTHTNFALKYFITIQTIRLKINNTN